MITRQLYSAVRKRFCNCLSTVASPKIENELVEDVTTKKISKENEILQYPDYFKVHNLFTVKDLFDAKVHYGHKVSSLHDNMKPFVFGSRLGHVIFDLDVTAYHLREALNFAAHIAYRNGIILFVSKNPRMTVLVEKTALACKEYAVTREWLLGVFTDSDKTFKTTIRLPDLCIILNTLEDNGFQHPVIAEAAKMSIPTIGVVDSNSNPNLITYPIPGNDDSLSCFQLYCKLFKTAILRGKNERQKDDMEMEKSERQVDDIKMEKNESEKKSNTDNSKIVSSLTGTDTGESQ